MSNNEQHDSENVRLRHENARLKAELQQAHEQLHARISASDYGAWRITFQSPEAAAQAAFNMMMQAREQMTTWSDDASSLEVGDLYVFHVPLKGNNDFFIVGHVDENGEIIDSEGNHSGYDFSGCEKWMRVNL